MCSMRDNNGHKGLWLLKVAIFTTVFKVICCSESVNLSQLMGFDLPRKPYWETICSLWIEREREGENESGRA